jgi:D-sedoheptulose 7-phosphate isomerase
MSGNRVSRLSVNEVDPRFDERPSFFTLPPGPERQEDHARQAIFDITKAIADLNACELDLVAELIASGLINQRKVMILGNGGSCATASHFATDLTLMAREMRLRVSVDALHESSSLMTAMANDYGFAESGAALVEAHASSGDILLMFSCSGRSPNLVNAAHTAARLGVLTILVGSRLAPSDFPASHRILVQAEHYSVIESAHSVVAHIIVDLLRIRFGVESPRRPRVFT